MTPRDLKAQAEQLRRQAAGLIAEAIVLETAARELERLHGAAGDVTLSTVPAAATVDTEHARRLRTSQSRMGAGDFDKALASSGNTLQTLADQLAKRKLPAHRSALSLWRHGKRSIPEAYAVAIEEITGFPVTAWPKRRP